MHGVQTEAERVSVVSIEGDRLVELAPRWAVYDLGVPQAGWMVPGFRRVLDVVAATVLIVLSLPLMLLLALIIRLDSAGPALFWQERMTQDRRRARREPFTGGRRFVEASGAERRGRDMAGRPFQFVKFRTMWVDAKQRFPELYRYGYTDEEILSLKFKLDDDPRRTRVGRWLRTTSLDELPNLWNVLTGDMTLVGPRPEIPEMSRFYTPAQRRKFAVRPGVTGLAQVAGRGQLTFQETVQLDVEYVTRRSVRLDLWLLWRTLVSVAKQTGAF